MEIVNRDSIENNFQIVNAYDSHVHFLATGDVALGLRLFDVTSLSDLQKIKIQSDHQRGEWIYGFGWNEKQFQPGFHMNVDILDKLYPDRPVLFSRVDGHSSCLNSLGLTKLSALGLHPIHGVLKEKEHIQALVSLPPLTAAQIEKRLLKAQQLFLLEGITHIRDMTMDLPTWEILQHLESETKLLMHVECNFSCEKVTDIDLLLKKLVTLSSSSKKLLKIRGLKIFFDGSLGSKTALVKTTTGDIQGLQLWPDEHVIELMTKTWDLGFEVSIHALGDEAVHRVVQLARKVYSQGSSGVLNLEHTQIVRPETIAMMKSLHVKCHMQPCHWLSDFPWLSKEKHLYLNYLFPWSALSTAQVPIHFGSDTPIETPSLTRNLEALKKSKLQGITLPKGDILSYFTYPHKDGQTTTSYFAESVLQKIKWPDRTLTREEIATFQ